MIALLAAALAQEVAVTEARYRELVTREQQLVVCTEAQDRTLDALLACYRRAGEARELIREQLDEEEQGDEAALEQLAAVAEERDALSRRLARVRSQRNTLAAVGLAVLVSGAISVAIPR